METLSISISKIESGHFHPTDENLERIAKARKC